MESFEVLAWQRLSARGVFSRLHADFASRENGHRSTIPLVCVLILAATNASAQITRPQLPADKLLLLQPTTIDFERAPNGASLQPGHQVRFEFREQNIVFPDGVEIIQCGAGRECPRAKSGTNVIAGNFHAEFNRRAIEIMFPRPVAWVEAHVSTISKSRLSRRIVAVAYDGSGNQVARTTTTLSGTTTTTGRKIRLDAQGPRITKVVITSSPSQGQTSNLHFLDDLRIPPTAAAAAAQDTERPVVTILSVQFTSSAPRSSFRLRVTDNTRISFVDLQVIYPDRRQRAGFICGRGTDRCPPQRYEGDIQIEFDPRTSGLYIANVRACDTSNNCATGRAELAYSAPPTPAPPPNVIVGAVEINQGVQGRLWRPLSQGDPETYDSDAILVPNKDTLFRYYIFARDQATATVSARLELEVTDQGGGIHRHEIPNTNISASSIVRVPTRDAREGRFFTMRYNLGSTYNFVVPADRIANAKDITARLRISGRYQSISVVQIRLFPPVALGLNIVRIDRAGEGAPTRLNIDQTVVPDIRTLLPVSEFRVLSERTQLFGRHLWNRDACDNILDAMEVIYGEGNAPEMSSPSGNPAWTATQGYAIDFRPDNTCGGQGSMPFLSSPETSICDDLFYADSLNDDDVRHGQVSISVVREISPVHEIGHNMGLPHASNGHEEAAGGVWERWPHDHGTVGIHGANATFGIRLEPPTGLGGWNVELEPPCDYGPGVQGGPRLLNCPESIPGRGETSFRLHDLMSYGSRRWPSILTYNRLYFVIRDGRMEPHLQLGTFPCFIRASLQVAQKGADLNAGRPPRNRRSQEWEAMIVSGRFTTSNQIELHPVQRKRVSAALLDGEGHGAFIVEVYDRRGKVIAWRRANAGYRTRYHSPSLNLRAVLPYTPAARRVIVKHKGRVIGEMKASANAPVVELLRPRVGETVAGRAYIVSWRARDQDGDPLTTLVQFSPDGGRTWQGLHFAHPRDPEEFPLDVTELPRTSEAVFRVVVSDGLNTAVAMTNGFIGLHQPAKSGTPLPSRTGVEQEKLSQ